MASRDRRTGFTLVEILLAMVVSGVVLSAIYGLLTTQFRTYSKVRERSDVHTSLRAAGALLAWELRAVAAASGDLRDIQPHALTLRSIQGTGVICRKHLTNAWYGVALVEGEFTDAAVDSVLVFQPRGPGTADDTWRAVEVASLSFSPIALLSACAWPGGPAADLQLGLTPASPLDTAGIAVGSAVRAFREVTYGVHTRDDRSWLGWEVDGSWDVIAGPVREEDGVEFTYYDDSGATTTDPASVAAVEVVLRAESDGVAAPGAAVESDSLSFRVPLRN